MDELEIIAQPNDAYFKQVFSDPQRATLFFQTHLDTEGGGADRLVIPKAGTGLLCEANPPAGASDLLFSVRLGERELKLYLLFEHQTTVDTEMPLRVLGYVLEILLAHFRTEGLPLPPVLPFVLHQGPDRWTVSPCFEDMFELSDAHASALLPYLPKFRHALLDLTQSDPDKDEMHDQLRLVFQLMKMARQKRVAEFLLWIAEAMSRPDWEVEETLILLSYLYVMSVDAKIDEKQIAHSLKNKPHLQENVMSLAQQLIARGEARGEARGVWIGKIQLLEQMMGSVITTTAELEALGLEKLEERFTVLEQTYSAKFKQL